MAAEITVCFFKCIDNARQISLKEEGQGGRGKNSFSEQKAAVCVRSFVKTFISRVNSSQLRTSTL